MQAVSEGKKDKCLDCDRMPCVCDLEMDEYEEEMESDHCEECDSILCDTCGACPECDECECEDDE